MRPGSRPAVSAPSGGPGSRVPVADSTRPPRRGRGCEDPGIGHRGGDDNVAGMGIADALDCSTTTVLTIMRKHGWVGRRGSHRAAHRSTDGTHPEPDACTRDTCSPSEFLALVGPPTTTEQDPETSVQSAQGKRSFGVGDIVLPQPEVLNGRADRDHDMRLAGVANGPSGEELFGAVQPDEQRDHRFRVSPWPHGDTGRALLIHVVRHHPRVSNICAHRDWSSVVQRRGTCLRAVVPLRTGPAQ